MKWDTLMGQSKMGQETITHKRNIRVNLTNIYSCTPKPQKVIYNFECLMMCIKKELTHQ